MANKSMVTHKSPEAITKSAGGREIQFPRRSSQAAPAAARWASVILLIDLNRRDISAAYQTRPSAAPCFYAWF
jgi:hypothetical protein